MLTGWSSEKRSSCTAESGAPAVHRITYGDEIILSVYGGFSLTSYHGTVAEISGRSMSKAAQSLANAKQSWVKELELPQILSRGRRPSDMIDLAQRLGYLRYATPLFERLLTGVTISCKGATKDIAFSLGFIEERFEAWLASLSQGTTSESEVREEVMRKAFTALEIEFGSHTLQCSLEDLGRARLLDNGDWFVPHRETDSGAGEIIRVFVWS